MSAEATPEGVVEGAASDGTLVVHRPERRFPVLPEAIPVPLARPPAPPQDPTGMLWSVLTPVIGSLSLVAFAFIVRNPIYLAVALLVVVGMSVAVVGSRIATNRKQDRQWRRQRRAWLRSATLAEERAAAAARRQLDALEGTCPPLSRLLPVVQGQLALWERRPQHADFLHVRLGTGPAPALAPVAGSDLDEPDPLGDPALERRRAEVVAASRYVEDAPLTADLATLSSLAVVGPEGSSSEQLQAFVAQLTALCSPDDVRFIGLVDEDRAERWDWVKWLPHTRDISAGEGFARMQRGITADPEAFALQLELATAERQRVAGDDDRSAAARLAALPHVVVVLDGYDPSSALARNRQLRALLERGQELRATVLLSATSPARVPQHCSATLARSDDGSYLLVEAGAGGRVTGPVTPDPWDGEEALRLARWLSPRRAGADSAGRRDNTIRLSEMLGVDLMSELGQQPAWRTQTGLYGGSFDDRDLLVARIGITDDGSPIELNLREAAQRGDGPHGVMVGATGSGKSELLRTIVAGLAATHPPELLNVLAIDFKGGAAFAGLDDLPHLVGLVTNLEEQPALIDRMQTSLDGEVRRRQSVIVSAGVDDIQQYRALGGDRPPMPYLFVVVDEFSELLSARPEFITTLVAIGRLGRSLGIHMLLATQRLDEGRLRGLEANLRYRIALRTFTAQDSTQIIGSSVAYELPPLPGLGYLKVDSGLTRFKAATTSVPQRRATVTTRAAATARPFSLSATVRRDDPRDRLVEAEERTELAVLRDLILAQDTTRPRPVWLPPLPERLTLGELWETHPSSHGRAVGLVDRPAQQAQEPLRVDRAGHLALAGAPQTGKSTFLRSLALAVTTDRSPHEVQLYGIDSGGGVAAIAALPHTGAVVGRHQPDGIRRLLADVAAIVDERAAACRQASVGTLAELRELPDADRHLPAALRADIWVLIDNIGILRAEHPDEELGLGNLAATSLPFGVRFVVAAGRWLDVRPGLLDAITTRLELRFSDAADSQLSRAAARELPEVPGRGLVAGGLQLQVALPLLGELTSEQETFRRAAAVAEERWPGLRAPVITPLPARVTTADLPRLASAGGRGAPSVAPDQFVLGLHEHRLTPVVLDLLEPGRHLLVHGDQRSGKTTLLRRALEHLVATRTPDEVRLHIVDLHRGLLDLADVPHVESYSFALSQVTSLSKTLFDVAFGRLPPPDLTRRQLVDRSWWTGPEHVLVVDDYQLLVHGNTSPLAGLAGPLAQAQDLGLHVWSARTVRGSARSMFEDFGKQLQEVAPVAVVLPGDPGEGPVFGGVTARPGPAGRAQLLLPGGRPSVVQLLAADQVPA